MGTPVTVLKVGQAWPTCDLINRLLSPKRLEIPIRIFRADEPLVLINGPSTDTDLHSPSPHATPSSPGIELALQSCLLKAFGHENALDKLQSVRESQAYLIRLKATTKQLRY